MVLNRAIGGIVALTVVVAGALPARAALSTNPDPSWMTNGKVFAMAPVGGTMYVGGTFTQIRSTPAGVAGPKVWTTNIGAIDIATGVGIKAFHHELTHSTLTAWVQAIAPSPDGSRIYVGGRFDSVDGVPARNIVAFDTATGAVDTSFDASGGADSATVYSILPSPDGSRIFVGGSFTTFNGTKRTRLAALLPDGSLDANWDASADKHVRSLALSADGATIFVGGAFTRVNGQTRQQVARIRTSDGVLDSWSIPVGTLPQPMVAWSLQASGSRLFGGFGKGPNFAAAFRLDNGSTGSQVWRFSTVGNVQEVLLAEGGSRLLIGGHFGTGNLQHRVCGSTYLRGLASLDPGSGALDCSWIPQLSPWGNNYQGVWELDLALDHLWFSGRFNMVEGVRQQNIARVPV